MKQKEKDLRPSWAHTMQLHRLRKQGYHLRHCAMAMDLPLLEVERIYLWNLKQEKDRASLMRVESKTYAKLLARRATGVIPARYLKPSHNPQ